MRTEEDMFELSSKPDCLEGSVNPRDELGKTAEFFFPLWLQKGDSTQTQETSDKTPPTVKDCRLRIKNIQSPAMVLVRKKSDNKSQTHCLNKFLNFKEIEQYNEKGECLANRADSKGNQAQSEASTDILTKLPQLPALKLRKTHSSQKLGTMSSYDLRKDLISKSRNLACGRSNQKSPRQCGKEPLSCLNSPGTIQGAFFEANNRQGERFTAPIMSYDTEQEYFKRTPQVANSYPPSKETLESDGFKLQGGIRKPVILKRLSRQQSTIISKIFADK